MPVVAAFFLAVVQYAFPQPATINLSNYEADQPIFYWSGSGPTGRAPVAGTLVQLLGRPTGTGEFSLIPNLSQQTTFTLNEPGFFEAGVGIVPNVRGGDPAELYIRAWRGASTWEEAVANPSAGVGQSDIFQNPTADDTSFLRPAALVNAPSFTIFPVPEPSSWALAALALILFWGRLPKEN